MVDVPAVALLIISGRGYLIGHLEMRANPCGENPSVSLAHNRPIGHFDPSQPALLVIPYKLASLRGCTHRLPGGHEARKLAEIRTSISCIVTARAQMKQGKNQCFVTRFPEPS